VMRMHAALSAGLAALFVLPRFAGTGDDPAVLQASLTRTVRALEVLAGIEARVRVQDAAVVGDVLSATEPAGTDPAAANEALETLRREVSLLQMELDSLESAPVPSADSAAAEPGAGSLSITTGLDETTRRALSLPLGAEQSASEAAPANEPPPAPVSLEGPGYSADPLRHALTCLRTGRPERALELLAGREDLESLYWRSRALADLERIDEAIELLSRIIAAAGDDYAARRASTDLEFLRWKQGFRARLPEGLRGKTEGPR
jgi:hypothetical protein